MPFPVIEPTIEQSLTERLAEALDFVSQFKDIPDVRECDVTTMPRNDVERMNYWDLAAITTNTTDFRGFPGYAVLLIAKARRLHPHFDPVWRKANGYPEVI